MRQYLFAVEYRDDATKPAAAEDCRGR